jgi:hypothetical protein
MREVHRGSRPAYSPEGYFIRQATRPKPVPVNHAPEGGRSLTSTIESAAWVYACRCGSASEPVQRSWESFTSVRFGRLPVASLPSGLCFSGGVASIRRRTSSSWGVSLAEVIPDPNRSENARVATLYRLVGEFITTWTESEWLLMLVMSGLLQTDIERARIVLAASTNFRSKRELIDRLGQSFLPDQLLPEFNTLMAAVKHLSEKRNMLAHHRPYYIKGATFRYMNDQDPTQPNTFGRSQDVQLGNIRTWIREAHTLNGAIVGLTKKLRTTSLLQRARLIPEPIRDRAP